MIRNYNGKVNRSALRKLKKLCDSNQKSFEILRKAFLEKGELSFYRDLDPFDSCSDELSGTITLKSETEIKEYLKKLFHQHLEMYLSYKNPVRDHLLDALVEFLKENNGKFPNRDEMKQLEQKAEAQRLAELPSAIEMPLLDVEDVIIKEILELSVEIMEARRESKPDDIFVHLTNDTCKNELNLQDVYFSLSIDTSRYRYLYDRDSNLSDYSCTVTLRYDAIVNTIYFHYQHGTVYVRARDHNGTILNNRAITDRFVSVYKWIVAMAELEGIAFINEIECENFPHNIS